MPEPSGEPQRPDDQIVLARYLGAGSERVYTVADANRELETIASGPDFGSIPAIERWIETNVLRRILIDEARRRHVHEEPLTVRRIDDRIDGMLLQSVYDREVSARVMVSDDELREEYLARSAGQELPPFEQMPINLKEQLRSMAMEAKRERLLEQLTDSLRRKYPVTIDEALFQRLPWPQPTMLELPQQG